MRLGLEKSPMRLAGWAAFGSVLYLASLAVLLTFSRQRFNGSGCLFRFGLLLGALAPGSAIAMLAVSRLKDGLRREVWSEERVDELRTVMDWILWPLLSWALVAMMVVRWIQVPHAAAPGALLLMPINVIGALKAAVRRPVAAQPQWMEPATAIPLQSEHWGVQSPGNHQRQT